MIYFVQCQGSQRIKIGHTKCPIGRMQTIMGCNAYPVELLATVEGCRRVERSYHEKLIEYRVHGEWFEPCSAVLKAVSDAKIGVSLPPASVASASKGWADKKALNRLNKCKIIPEMFKSIEKEKSPC